MCGWVEGSEGLIPVQEICHPYSLHGAQWNIYRRHTIYQILHLSIFSQGEDPDFLSSQKIRYSSLLMQKHFDIEYFITHLSLATN